MRKRCLKSSRLEKLLSTYTTKNTNKKKNMFVFTLYCVTKLNSVNTNETNLMPTYLIEIEI